MHTQIFSCRNLNILVFEYTSMLFVIEEQKQKSKNLKNIYIRTKNVIKIYYVFLVFLFSFNDGQ